ncbi:hypothetical protein ACFWWM_27575 [Streptomyces sp. NPDC058682]|uniref:hypothetical protein n=1 Tax=Streptomyces sp. NPDC058682 TaxID=3346596 RepID=UPI003654787C
MNPLHRAPDWDQHADRHTRLIDPVVTVRQLRRLGPTRRPPTRIDHALVFTTARGEHTAYLPPQRPRSVLRRWTAVYEVDMGVHTVHTVIVLPSKDDAHEFEVAVALDWQVMDPARFVRSGHRDIPRLLIGELEQAARPVARQFAMTSSAAAEAAVLEALQQIKPLGEDAGLRSLWTLRLRRDEENIAHARRLQAIEHAASEGVHAQQQGALVDREAAERLRQQQQDQAQQIAFYRDYLALGGADAWALYMAQHPDRSGTALESLRQESQARLNAQVQLIQEVLAKDGTEAFELAGPRRLVLDNFHRVFGERLPDGAEPAHKDREANEPVTPPRSAAPEGPQ